MELHPAGHHVAKLIDYGVILTKNGDPMATATFQTSHGRVFWNGILKDGSDGQRNFTMEALIVMGLSSVQDVEALADGPASNALNMDREVSISVEHDSYNGKTTAKARWVNPVGEKKGISRDELKAKLSGLKNLRSDFSAAFEKSGKEKLIVPF